MIHLGQPSDLSSPTLHRYVYVVALAPRDTPDMVEFRSTEVSALDEDDAYLCFNPRFGGEAGRTPART